MSTPSPLVTIAIPTFNRSATLEVAIASALAQTHPHLEVVISDNCSSDATESHCRELVKAEPRLRYIRQNTNLGATANFQAVLAEAKGEFFMWLADDDWIDPDYVQVCVDLLRCDPTRQLVSGVCIYHPEGSPPFSGETILLDQPTPGQRVLCYYRSVQYNSVFYGLARTDTLRTQPPLRRFGDDWLLVASLARRGIVETTPSTHLHRSADGVSSTQRQPLRHMIGLNIRIFLESRSRTEGVGPVVALRCAAVVLRRKTLRMLRVNVSSMALKGARQVMTVLFPQAHTQEGLEGKERT